MKIIPASYQSKVLQKSCYLPTNSYNQRNNNSPSFKAELSNEQISQINTILVTYDHPEAISLSLSILLEILGQNGKMKILSDALCDKIIKALNDINRKTSSFNMNDFFQEEQKSSQKTHNHSYNDDNCYRKTSNFGWTAAQFITHIENRLSSKDMRKSSLKETEVRNLAKLLGITTDEVMNLSKKQYRTLCKKFHPDICKTTNGTSCFRIVQMLFKLQ